LGLEGGQAVKSYRDLEIYRLSYGPAIRVHNMSLKLPNFELYEEGSQVRKSSKGIPSAIAEGYGRRRYKADFVRYLIIAHGSCDETIVHLNFIKDTHDQVAEEATSFLPEYGELGSKINRFIQYVEREWK
jgi:four helix bundle protein